MDRREFLKKAIQVGGVAALYNLGVTLEQAQAWGVLPAVVGGAAASGSWADWDEASKDTLLVDQDGDGVEDTFIAFFENTVAGGDEIGVGGGLSEADRTLTENGNITGATGSPPSRALDGADDFFTSTQNCLDTLLLGSAWTIMVCIGSPDNTLNSEGPFDFRGPNTRISIVNSAGADTVLSFDPGDGGQNPAFGSLWTSLDKYFGCWYDGTDIRAGFCASKPTKWSDFTVNDRVSVTDTMAFTAFTTRNIGKNGSYEMAGDYYYIVISKVCLIDNAS